MQLTPDQQALFDQLGRSPVFMEWLAGEEARQVTVLKVNPNLVQLAQAQGAVQLIDRLRDYTKRK